MLMAGARQAREAPGEKDHTGRPPGMGVASLSYAESTFLLPHYGSRRGQEGEGPHSCVWSSLSYKTGKPFLKAPLAQGVFSSPKIVFMCRPYLADPALARVLG